MKKLVGSDPDVKVGNEKGGILIIGANNNFVGGLDDGVGNTIAYNGEALKLKGHGIEIVSGTGNLISRNSIFENSGRGIDLGDDSFTLNDPAVMKKDDATGQQIVASPPDADPGANNLQNYPSVAFVSFLGATKTITWDLFSTPDTVFTIEFFSNANPDPSGFGEGKTYLSTKIVPTDTDGFAEFTQIFDSSEDYISVTATDPHNNTSEFSIVDTDGDALADAWEAVGPDGSGFAGYIDITHCLDRPLRPGLTASGYPRPCMQPWPLPDA